MKYIKIWDGFVIDKKTAWIGHIEEEPDCEETKGFLWPRIIVKENPKFFFKIGDNKQSFTATCNTKEEALKEWERVLKLINDNYET